MKFILVNGFLGSGKTTAIVAACKQLMEQNKTVAVITNDQGDQQVDSEFVKSFKIPGGEVINGCFCCNYDQLDENITRLAAHDFIFAESVGSCTDLIATVVKPLNQLRPDIEITISIFADGELLTSIIEGRSTFFDESIRYIYKKQLEEADFLIINKADLLSSAQLLSLESLLKSEFPGKNILHQNSLNKHDIALWINNLDDFKSIDKRNSIDIDYTTYGTGESMLAWLDNSFEVHSKHGEAAFITGQILRSIYNTIQEHQLPVGHVKFFLDSGDWSGKISFTPTSVPPALSLPENESDVLSVIMNARVQTDPLRLEKIVDGILAKAEKKYGCRIITMKKAAFKPGFPRPTHRIMNEAIPTH